VPKVPSSRSTRSRADIFFAICSLPLHLKKTTKFQECDVYDALITVESTHMHLVSPHTHNVEVSRVWLMDAANLDMDSFTIVEAKDWEHYPQHIQKLSNTIYFSHSSYRDIFYFFTASVTRLQRRIWKKVVWSMKTLV
jgi:hypothetical protein